MKRYSEKTTSHIIKQLHQTLLDRLLRKNLTQTGAKVHTPRYIYNDIDLFYDYIKKLDHTEYAIST